MAIDAGQLLRRLELPVRASNYSAPVGRGSAGVDSALFGRMLALVSRSSGVGGRSVLLGCTPEPALDAAQMSRLSAAGEVAAEAGAQRALMLIDGRAFVMNVPDRELTAELSASSRHELIELDAAVYVASAEHEAAQARAGLPGLSALLPPAVAAQLEALGARDRPAHEPSENS